MTVPGSGLSKMPEASMADLTQVSAGMQQYIRASDMETRQAAIDTMSRQGVFRRLFPGAVDRERQRIATDSLRQMAESKREMLAVFTATQLEIARKRADALIAAQGMHLQAQLTQFAAQKIDELNSTLNESRSKFMAQMDPQYDDIERYQHRPQLYARAAASIEHQVNTYFDSTATLLNGFSQSLNNRVSQLHS